MVNLVGRHRPQREGRGHDALRLPACPRHHHQEGGRDAEGGEKHVPARPRLARLLIEPPEQTEAEIRAGGGESADRRVGGIGSGFAHGIVSKGGEAGGGEAGGGEAGGGEAGGGEAGGGEAGGGEAGGGEAGGGEAGGGEAGGGEAGGGEAGGETGAQKRPARDMNGFEHFSTSPTLTSVGGRPFDPSAQKAGAKKRRRPFWDRRRLSLFSMSIFQCRRRDSNSHALASTAT